MELNKSWIPPCESLGLKTEFYYTQDYMVKYWTMLYYSTLMYLVNETSPTVLYERQFVASVAIISAIVNTIIFGTITVLVRDLNKKDVQF